jgi:hypothetical protein
MAFGAPLDYSDILNFYDIPPPKKHSENEVKVGFWASDSFSFSNSFSNSFPISNSSTLSDSQKNKFLQQLDLVIKKSRVEQYLGFSICRICRCHNGAQEYYFKAKNGKTYIFPEGYQHYIKDHNVAINQEFFNIVMLFKEETK